MKFKYILFNLTLKITLMGNNENSQDYYIENINSYILQLEENRKYLGELRNDFIKNIENCFEKNYSLNLSWYLEELINQLQTNCNSEFHKKELIEKYKIFYKGYIHNIISFMSIEKKIRRINILNEMINNDDFIYLIPISEIINKEDYNIQYKLNYEELIKHQDHKYTILNYLKKKLYNDLKTKKLENTIDNYNITSKEEKEYTLKKIASLNKSIENQEKIFKENLSSLEKISL